jgi:hypothetical protein
MMVLILKFPSNLVGQIRVMAKSRVNARWDISVTRQKAREDYGEN